jgi:hypothetical protein
MAPTNIPSNAVGTGGDIAAPTTALPQALDLLDSETELQSAVNGPIDLTGPPQIVALSEAGATAASKGWVDGLAAPSDLVLSSAADVETVRIRDLRTKATNGARICVSVPGLPAAAASRSAIALNAAATDCGCQVGSRFGAAGLLLTLTIRGIPRHLADAAVILSGTIIMSFFGKLAGILLAHRRLSRELDHLRSSAYSLEVTRGSADGDVL